MATWPADDRTGRLLDAWTAAPREPQGWQRPGVAAEARAQVHFPPIANGLDYLRSASEHLVPPDPESAVTVRALKYAILHLAAGAEVLLKARLQLEHWTLIFKDPGQATRKELENGTFVSCTPSETLQRLRGIAEVHIDDKDAKALTQLADHRNALQHYGLIGSSAEVPAVESRTGAVLDFLIRFLDEELLPALTEAERTAVQGEMTEIRDSLVWINRFTIKRMQRLAADLEPFRASTVECSDCYQFALVVSNGDMARCYFCWSERPIEEALTLYTIVTQGRLPPASFEFCSTCASHTVLHGVTTAESPDPPTPVALCFTCGENFPTKPLCLLCNKPFEPVHNELGCANCMRLTGEQ